MSLNATDLKLFVVGVGSAPAHNSNYLNIILGSRR